jgi:hypothetical protein
MRFLIEHCKSAFAPLSCLNLTKRTIDKRQKVRDGGGEAEGREREGGVGGGRREGACVPLLPFSLLPTLSPPSVWHVRQNYKKLMYRLHIL